jgi:predicted lipoprotein with Yx(FWY)xxD motif
MKRTYTLAAGALASLAFASAPASAGQGTSNARAARGTTVQLRRTSLGAILVNASGFTLYRFTRDGRNRDACAKVSECLRNWPALRTSGKPTAGPGVKASLLSSIPLAGGGRQVTYAGHPLYIYGAQSERAETGYVGASQFGGTWDAVSSTGGLVK